MARTPVIAASTAVCLAMATLASCSNRDCGPYYYDRVRHVCTCPDGSVADPDSGVCSPVEVDASSPCVERAWFLDSDRDGHGDPASSVEACSAPDGYANIAGDCDDACAECHPGGSERCNTAADEDCDGNPVTDCGCVAGSAEHCRFCGDACDWACGPSGCNDAVDVAAGRNHTCVVREDRTVACWGSNEQGQLGTGDRTAASTAQTVSGLTDVLSVVVGGSHSCALAQDRSVRCWGSNSHGQIGASGGGAVAETPTAVVGYGVPLLSVDT